VIIENDHLQRFIDIVGPSESRSGGEELSITFGPFPGSFFADDGRTRYRWVNLPSDLEDAIQRLVCKHGYGKIVDIAINARGGWVVHKKNDDIEFGGQLPERLQQALLDAKRRKTSIKVLFFSLF
jgi:hypothetical protein